MSGGVGFQMKLDPVPMASKPEPLPVLGHPLPDPGVTVVHCLNDLSAASGPIWIPCLTNLLREAATLDRQSV